MPAKQNKLYYYLLEPRRKKQWLSQPEKKLLCIGIDIMAKGGNAFDAMVATELALAVSFPYAGNIGGGGFMVFRKSTGETGAIDYREKAPMAAHRDMYLVLYEM